MSGTNEKKGEAMKPDTMLGQPHMFARLVVGADGTEVLAPREFREALEQACERHELVVLHLKPRGIFRGYIAAVTGEENNAMVHVDGGLRFSASEIKRIRWFT